MMRHARTTSLLVVFYLLVSATTAYAECAWVLWKFPNGKFYKSGKSRELPYKEVPFQFHGMLPRMERAFPTYKECMAWPEAQAPDGEKIWVTSMRSEDTEILVGVTYACLPDTVDPSGPKGK